MKDYRMIYQPNAGPPGSLLPGTRCRYEPSEDLINLFCDELNRFRIGQLVIKQNFNIGCEPGNEDWHYGILYTDNDFKSYLCQDYWKKDGTVGLVKYEIDRTDMLTRTIGQLVPMKDYED